MTLVSDDGVGLELAQAFRRAGVHGFLSARDLLSGSEVAYQADAAVVTASVSKLPILVTLFRQADAGIVDLAERVTVPVEGRASGSTGLSVLLDPVTASWRDLALLMIAISDN